MENHRVIITKKSQVQTSAPVATTTTPLHGSRSDSIQTDVVSSFAIEPSNQFVDRVITKKDYVIFCFGFSLSVVPVVATLSFAPIIASWRTGGIGNGCFYLAYAVCSITLSKSIVNSFGCKAAIIYGQIGTVTYIAGLLISVAFIPDYTSVCYPFFSIIGGFFQAAMWTAQGAYFARCSQMFLTSMDFKEIEHMNRALANKFTLIYLLCLVCGFGVLTTIVALPFNSTVGVGPLYCVYSCVSFYLLFKVNDLGDVGDTSLSFKIRRGVYDMVRAALDMTSARRAKVGLLLPYHICWGCCTSFWIMFILGHIILQSNGVIAVGVACTLNVLMTLVFYNIDRLILKWHAHSLLIVIGGVCFCAMGVLGLLALSTNYFVVTLTYSALYGIARSVCDNNMMAVIADFFPQKEASAYSITGFAKTIAAGLSFIIFAVTTEGHIRRASYGGLVIITGFAGVVCYLLASRIDKKEKNVDAGLNSAGGEVVSPASRQTSTASDTVMYVPEYFY